MATTTETLQRARKATPDLERHRRAIERAPDARTDAVLVLRELGWTWQQIGHTLGVSQQQATKIGMRARFQLVSPVRCSKRRSPNTRPGYEQALTRPHSQQIIRSG
jgi:DNA-directed RNA polymerase specialized sigma24 family protein